MAAILGQAGVECRPLFYFVFHFWPWTDRFWDDQFSLPFLEPVLTSMACFGRRILCAVLDL